MSKIIYYHFDNEREMVYFSNNTQSHITSCGQFLWDGNFYYEDMKEVSMRTGYTFVYKDNNI